MRWDVIVIGAGPAGSMAASTSAKKGLKTLILEKAVFPRYKPCAGGVTAAAAGELENGIPPEIVERECRGVRLIYDGVARAVRQGTALTYMVRREKFDDYLLRLAVRCGAKVVEGEEVLDLESGADGVTVRTAKRSERAPLLIGADGYFSRVRKAVGYRFGSGETIFCVIADIPLSESDIARRFSDCFTIHYGVLDRGYGWLFPKSDHVSAGIGGECIEPRSLPELFRTFMGMHGLRYEGKVRGCFLPVSKSRHRSFADRVLLAGDAAGFVDPFTGEGIRFALLSGKLAGISAALCHERGDFSARSLRSYEDLWYPAFGEDLLRSNRITDITFRHKSLVFGVALGKGRVLERYMKTMTGELRLGEMVPWLRRRMPLLLLRNIFRVAKLWMRKISKREGVHEVHSYG